MKKSVLFFVVVLFFLSPLPSIAQGNSATLLVDAGKSLGNISRFLYGANYGAYGIISPNLDDPVATYFLKLIRALPGI